MNGKSHPYSWARLPKVAIFSNWEQANSFAIRVEWEHPKGSGNWRFTYVQPDKHLGVRLDRNIPGSLRRYGLGTAVIHWIFGQKPSYTLPWIPKPFGAMQVLAVQYDIMTQSIQLKLPDKLYNIVAARANSDQDIRRQMLALSIPGRPTSTTGLGHRMNCDTCIILTEQQMNPDTKYCTVAAGETACANCKALGLPYCPWTPRFKSYKFWNTNTLEEQEDTKRMFTNLIAAPLADFTNTFKQNFRSLAPKDPAGDVAEDSEGEREFNLDDDSD